MCVCVCVCVCVRACVRARARTRVCVCVCLCVWKSNTFESHSAVTDGARLFRPGLVHFFYLITYFIYSFLCRERAGVGGRGRAGK